MRFYNFPKPLRVFYPGAMWEIKPIGKVLYLTFDDGPTPEVTEFVLTLLKQFNARATFFCLGKNAENHSEIYQRILAEGHTVGSHGYNHIKGWGESTKPYIDNVLKAEEIITTKFFRPPYGKITSKQFKEIKRLGYITVFWSILSYDFDASYALSKRQSMLLKRAKPGSNIVFHDSKKAFKQLKTDLPILLKAWSKEGYEFKAIEKQVVS